MTHAHSNTQLCEQCVVVNNFLSILFNCKVTKAHKDKHSMNFSFAYLMEWRSWAENDLCGCTYMHLVILSRFSILLNVYHNEIIFIFMCYMEFQFVFFLFYSISSVFICRWSRAEVAIALFPTVYFIQFTHKYSASSKSG